MGIRTVTDAFDDPDFDPDTAELVELDEAITEHYGYLLDENAKMIQWSRAGVQGAKDIADSYRRMAEEADHIAELHAIGARRAADLMGDVISQEYGLVSTDSGTPKEEEDDDSDS